MHHHPYHNSCDFYPRPPRGGRPSAIDLIHAGLLFLSTPSARRATRDHHHDRQGDGISIHALREEGDFALPIAPVFVTNFYPRPPRGGRHGRICAAMPSTLFLSTPSARRATHSSCSVLRHSLISIHALREEGDLQLRVILRGHA